MRLREPKTLILTFFLICTQSASPACLPPAEQPRRAMAERTRQETVEQDVAWAETVGLRLDSLVRSDSLLLTTQLGLYVYDLTADQPLYRHHADQRMRPASCQKVVTAVTALQLLGADHRLATCVKTTGQVKADGTLDGDLYIVGSMDPLLAKADLHTLARTLQQAGVKSLGGRMYVDVSMKDNEPLGWGWCWDDDYGPLSVLTVDGKNTFASEWLSALKAAKIAVPQRALTKASPHKTAGVLALPADGLAEAVCPRDAQLLAEVAHTVQDILPRMMKESDNIFAESLFYQLAANSGEKGAGHKQAAKQMGALLDSLGIVPGDCQIADGSGLSLYNYLSPALLVQLLRHARQQPFYGLFLNTLPIAAVDGTLKKRLTATHAAGNVRAKTGTVTGISSLAGYLTAANGHECCFAIINQGIAQGAPARAFQDKICLLLTE